MPGITPSAATPARQAIESQNSHRWMRQMRRRSAISNSPIAAAITTAASALLGAVLRTWGLGLLPMYYLETFLLLVVLNCSGILGPVSVGVLLLPYLRSGGRAEVRRVLAERAHPGWRATLEGRRLETTDLDWRQAFTLPAGAEGTLTITYVDPLLTLWTVGQVVVLGLAGLLALPTRRRSPGEDA